MAASQCKRRQIDPAPLLPAGKRRFDELDALGAFLERPLVGCGVDDVADEVLPLDLEAVVVRLRIGNDLPLVVEVHRLLDVGIPDRPRRRYARLRTTLLKAGYCRPIGAVDVESGEVVAAHARRP